MSDRWESVRVSGDFALFTRPESKVERVSYEVITPSAARGVLEAIFWHPQFTWCVREVRVLKKVQTIGILRNEVNSKMSPARSEPYFADDDRTQRYSVCLRDVEYVISADLQMKPGATDHPQKYREQFQRRVERGQCFHRPALGCREFAAEFGPCSGDEIAVDWEADLGLMLWDLDYSTKPPFWPRFFEARVNKGVMNIPIAPIGAQR